MMNKYTGNTQDLLSAALGTCHNLGAGGVSEAMNWTVGFTPLVATGMQEDKRFWQRRNRMIRAIGYTQADDIPTHNIFA
jgi:hypothetical protein